MLIHCPGVACCSWEHGGELHLARQEVNIWSKMLLAVNVLHIKNIQMSEVFQSTVCCQFVLKCLTNISVYRLLSVCAQTVVRYIRTKRKRKFHENQENKT